MASILFLTQVLPYPIDAGPKTRAYYVLRYLAGAGHQVSLLSFVRDTDRPEYIEHLRSWLQSVEVVPIHRSARQDVWRLLRSLPGATPFLIARDWTPEMAQAIAKAPLAEFDFVHADQLWMAPYALLARSNAEQPRLQVVLDQHNAVFQILRRLAQGERNPAKRSLLALESRKLARYEARMVEMVDRVVWVTAEDRQAVADWACGPSPATPAAKVATQHVIIPICVDPDQERPITRSGSARRVTFVGGLHWPPNAEGVLWFVAQIWPLVQAQVPDAVLTVIGKSPPQALIKGQPRGGNVDVTGYVEDLRPYLQETAVFIAPLHAGGGMRVKILDAWRWGLPVVSTTIGAEGLRIAQEENLLLADTAENFAQAVVRVMGDPALAERLIAGARASVERDYNWRTVYRAWDEVYAPESDQWHAVSGQAISASSS